MSDYRAVLQTPELGPGHSREIDLHGEPVLVLNLGQRYYALESRCPVHGSALQLRALREGDRLRCPEDGAEYEVPSGRRLGGTGRALRRYDVRVEGNAILVGSAG